MKIKNSIPKNIFLLISAFSISIFISGCATAPYVPPPPPAVMNVPGAYHHVKAGQTLWRIAKAYGQEIEEIANINRLPNAAKISVGQLLFIPGAATEIDVDSAGFSKQEGFIWPIKGDVISYFGAILENVKSKGINIRAREGVAILASRDGIAKFCSENTKGFGKIIILDHGDGFSTVYAHNSENIIKRGDNVKQGMVIAKVGKTGRCSSPNLYFEIRKRHVPQNPFYYLP